jgi:hypothetical protein
MEAALIFHCPLRRINARLITRRIPVQMAKKYVEGLRHCQTMCCQKWKSSTSEAKIVFVYAFIFEFLKKMADY